MSQDFTVRRLGRSEAVARASRVAEIYRAALGAQAEPTSHFAKTFRSCMETYDGATVLAGLDSADGELVGFLYGFDLQRGHWWPQQVEPSLREAGHSDWLEDCFELVELEVDPVWQGRGIGTRLLTQQLSEMPHRRALLATDPDGRARGLYQRMGFVDLVPDFVYAGTTYRATLMGWDRQAGGVTPPG